MLITHVENFQSVYNATVIQRLLDEDAILAQPTEYG